jgi:hypothetical protein
MADNPENRTKNSNISSTVRLKLLDNTLSINIGEDDFI